MLNSCSASLVGVLFTLLFHYSLKILKFKFQISSTKKQTISNPPAGAKRVVFVSTMCQWVVC